jgi:hypothetical protein
MAVRNEAECDKIFTGAQDLRIRQDVDNPNMCMRQIVAGA